MPKCDSDQRHDEFLVDPDEPIWRKAVGTAVVCAIAGAVFVWVSGHVPGRVKPDVRLAVAECWDAIEQSQSAGNLLHDMRVACQRMESGLAASMPTGRPGQVIAAGE